MGWGGESGLRPAGGVALHSALHAGRGRAELPDPRTYPGADLGRPGAANDRERQDPALVERHASASPLGGPAPALWARAAGGIGFGRGTQGTGAGFVVAAGPA